MQFRPLVVCSHPPTHHCAIDCVSVISCPHVYVKVKEVVQVKFSFITYQHLFWVKESCHLWVYPGSIKKSTACCQTT